VSGKQQVCVPPRNLASDNDIVANNCAESVNLCAELDLDDLTGLEDGLCFLEVGFERGVGRDVGAWGDGDGVAGTLCDFLALEDLGYFFRKECVAFFAEINDNCAVCAPFCGGC
jgi:hypothetical protein